MKQKNKNLNSQSDLKVAIITDPLIKIEYWYDQLMSILKTFSNSEIYTPYYKQEIIKKFFPTTQVHDSFLQLITPADNNSEFWLKMEKIAYKTFRFKDYDVLISISSRAARFARSNKNLPHIAIVLEPKNLFSTKILQQKEIKVIKNLNAVISNSNSDKRKLRRLYGVNADIIYPPIEVKKFKPEKILHRKENWFLSTTNMSTRSLKMLIKASVQSNTPLKIVGALKEGLDAEELIKEFKARGIVKFVGNISEEESLNLMQRCRAFIYPVRSRKFARIPIEANAAGTPVIAYKRGSVIETISTQYPKTGVFFNKYNYKSLAKVLENFKDNEFDSKNCIMKAEEYDSSIFMYKLKTYVEDTVQSN
jgi:glycosyltransferase involved in cell wall biosynthesis